MDIWKYFGITHRDHLICNPTSAAKLDELVERLPLQPGARVLDVACGKAEALLRIVERHQASGVGVDISTYEVAEAHRRIAARGLEGRAVVINMDGAKHDTEPQSFDLAMCIGATWVWDGYAGTIEALKRKVVPGGLIAIGEPFKMREPDPEYAAAEPELAATLATHADNVAMAQQAGLTFLYAIVSSQDDWDRYEHLQTRAAELYAIEQPDDPDVPELLRRRREADERYLTWGRDTLNWAVYLFRSADA
jgi:cyclopropane fatty-acyl-phospholipid synthase-like methyltransferase